MYLFVVALHVILCILLVLIILLQPGKGGDVGAAFGGGGGGGVFGPRGPATLLGRATTGVAVMFMVTSIALALYSNENILNDSNVEELLLADEPEATGRVDLTPDDPATDGGEAVVGEPAAPVEPAPGAGE